MDIALKCNDIQIVPDGVYYIIASLNIDEAHFFEALDLEEVLNFHGDGKFLDLIGEDRVREYFNLKGIDE